MLLVPGRQAESKDIDLILIRKAIRLERKLELKQSLETSLEIP